MNRPIDSAEAHEWRQRDRDRRMEKLEQKRTNGEFNWDPEEDPEEEEDDS